jgi:DNA-binding MarR family transcriptional regulator
LTDTQKVLADEALHKFLSMYRYLRQYGRQMTVQGIKPRQFSVLLFLQENGSATVGEVQDYLYLSPSTTSVVVAELEEAGLVTRSRSTTDNRVVNVQLTPAGQAIAQNSPPGGIALLRRRLDTLPAARLTQMIEALNDIMSLMEVTETE